MKLNKILLSLNVFIFFLQGTSDQSMYIAYTEPVVHVILLFTFEFTATTESD